MDEMDFAAWLAKEAAEKSRRMYAPRVRAFLHVRRRLVEEISEFNTKGDQKLTLTETRPSPTRMSFELTYGKLRICRVMLAEGFSHIEVVMKTEDDPPYGAKEKLLAFILKNEGLAARAYELALEPLPYAETEVQPREIARKIIGGLIRGSFE
jgi:hypothetical protein